MLAMSFFIRYLEQEVWNLKVFWNLSMSQESVIVYILNIMKVKNPTLPQSTIQ